MAIFDVTENEFQARVVDRSREVPVVVDFWAAWCGPCRQLTPLLEREASRHEGALDLAKVDTDANPYVSQAFGIQGIPAVKAFRDGRVVSEFVGAQPPPVVERFFTALVPSEAETLAAAGDEASLRRAVELEPTRADAAVPLARILLQRGERDEAERVLAPIVGDFQAEGLKARLRLEDAGEPDLAEAFAALDAGDVERGIDLLIEALPSADGRKDDIRQVVVAVLDQLGVEHPLARETRRRLAAALY
ncbi:MAG TPA: tetratricopeptide repeat protein [Solirubrobacteraceae bacterium]